MNEIPAHDRVLSRHLRLCRLLNLNPGDLAANLQKNCDLPLMSLVLRLMWDREGVRPEKRGRGRPKHPYVDHWIERVRVVQAELSVNGRHNGDRQRAIQVVAREHAALEKELNDADPGRTPVPFDVNAIENKMRRPGKVSA